MPRWPKQVHHEAEFAEKRTPEKSGRRKVIDRLNALSDDQFKTLTDLLRRHGFVGDKDVR